MFCLEH